MWDDEYSVDAYVYGTRPNDFLAAMTDRLKKGRALCLAEGEGRNAVHLAKAGFAPVAVDSSRVGLAKASKLAAEQGVAISTVLADLADYPIEPESWDTIVSVWCHVMPELRKRLHRDVVAGLKKGGTLLLEAYTPEQLEYGTGGPPQAERMMRLATLREELAGLRIVHGEELERNVVEGTHHTGLGSVVQVLAVKD